MERLKAKYLVESPLALEAAAAVLAGEQSTGTFVDVPGETNELKARFAARVESCTPIGRFPTPSLPGSRPTASAYHRGEVEVSWSVENFGGNLPTLVSTLQGNLYELSQFSGLRLLDFEIPSGWAGQFRGPAFGVEGTRRVANVRGRPLIGTIIKPSIGMSPQQTAELVGTLAGAGIDFIKDDELQANAPHSPFDARVDAIMDVLNRHADKTGKKVLYAFNISDEVDPMLRHYEKVVRSGGSCAMMSLNAVGLSAAKRIADIGTLPLHGHRNGWGMLTRDPLLGIAFPAYQKLWRLAGIDQLHVNGMSNKFYESDDSVETSIRSCLESKPFRPVLPVVSSGQWGGQAPETYRRVRSTDLLYLAGGGILAHPKGPGAGIQSLQLWWQAAVEGLSVSEAIAKYPDLAASQQKFGKAK